MNKIFFFILLVGVVLFWFGEKRKFYQFGDGKYLTVWKTYGGVCYIIPGKYFGIIKPSDGYIQSPITDAIVLFSSKQFGDTIVYNSLSSVTPVNSISKHIYFLDLNLEKERVYPFLYENTMTKATEVKQGVKYLHVLIRDNFAIGKNGIRLN
nr:hypothetical protein [uncultured Sediminibacterium sp.]